MSRAAADPDTFVIAIDADARSMADASRRASGRPSRGALPNIVFLAEGAERLPTAFDGLAEQVTVLFPWGTLLRGALGLDPSVTAAIARLVAPDGRLRIVVSVVERDRGAVGGAGDFGSDDLDRMTEAYRSIGLDIGGVRRLTPADVTGTGSSWARRLRSDPERPVWLVEFVRTIRAPSMSDRLGTRSAL